MADVCDDRVSERVGENLGVNLYPHTEVDSDDPVYEMVTVAKYSTVSIATLNEESEYVQVAAASASNNSKVMKSNKLIYLVVVLACVVLACVVLLVIITGSTAAFSLEIIGLKSSIQQTLHTNRESEIISHLQQINGTFANIEVMLDNIGVQMQQLNDSILSVQDKLGELQSSQDSQIQQLNISTDRRFLSIENRLANDTNHQNSRIQQLNISLDSHFSCVENNNNKIKQLNTSVGRRFFSIESRLQDDVNLQNVKFQQLNTSLDSISQLALFCSQ
jgi:uncharacterized coiled-coil protein SlyX